VKVVCGLGNPGPEYAATRHNLGWWVLDRVAADWGLGAFRRIGIASVAEGIFGGHQILLIKPLTYVNRSGQALQPLATLEGFVVSRDLLVVVDDVALDVGRVRFRARGSAGGHNGLRSIEAALGTRDYARLRIGVGAPPPGVPLADYVLAPFPPEEEERICALLPELAEAVGVWVREGIERAAQRFNR
jgi:PTH1 family peptidyl-tRNA hydrolase